MTDTTTDTDVRQHQLGADDCWCIESADTSTGELRVMNASGDSKHTWDRNNEAEVEAARALFDSLVGGSKYLAYSVTSGGAGGSVMRTFDPEAGAMILQPQLVGG